LSLKPCDLGAAALDVFFSTPVPTRMLVSGQDRAPAGRFDLVLVEGRNDLHQPHRAHVAFRNGIESRFDRNHGENERTSPADAPRAAAPIRSRRLDGNPILATRIARSIDESALRRTGVVALETFVV
jgi:hypothetical protein